MFSRGDRVINSSSPAWGVGHVLYISDNKVHIFFAEGMTERKLSLNFAALEKLTGNSAHDDVLDNPLSLSYLPQFPFDTKYLADVIKAELEKLDINNTTVQKHIKEVLLYTRREFNKVMGQQYEGLVPPFGYKRTSDSVKKSFYLEEAFLLRKKYEIIARVAIPQLKEYQTVLEMMDSNIKNRDRY